MNRRSRFGFQHWIAVGFAVFQAFNLSYPAHQGGTAIRDTAGHPFNPFEHDKGKVIVLVFTCIDCPISNAYAPKIRRLCEEFADSGIVFLLVHCDPDESLEAIENHRKEFLYPCAALFDPGHELVRRAQAHVTPEAAVFRPDGTLVYHGRIDNQYVEFGKRRPEATQEDLKLVLKAVTEGHPPQIKSSRAIGCSIASLK